MANIWKFIRHNQGIACGALICVFVLIWAYGCQAKVVSIKNAPAMVTRAMLELEVDHFLKAAEIRFSELDQKEEFQRTIFALAVEFMSGGKINPVAIALTLGNILGLGAVIDNARKRTLINTLKGDHAKVKEEVESEDTS